MDLSNRVLGSNVATQLRQRATSVLLQIGSDTFDRAALAHVACFNFTAAAILSAILNRELKVTNTKDVFQNVSPRELALPRLGAVSIAVLGAAFEAMGLGGDAPLEAWVMKHTAKDVKVVTFVSLKARDEEERAAEKRRAKNRKHARRDQAHGLRLARFDQRKAG